MKIFTIILFLLCTFSPFLADGKPQLLSNSSLTTAAQLRDRALEENLAWSIVESLTTEVGPRMAGSAGDPKAVKWAKNKFKSLKFDKVWTEAVTFPTWKRGIEVANIISPYPHKLVITALGNSISTPETGLQAEIVQFDTLQDLIASNRAELEGKIAFISKKMPRFRDGHGYSETVNGRSSGAVEASKKGAVALLIRSVGTDNDRIAHTGNMNYVEGVKPIPAAALSNPDADLLMNMLRREIPVTLNLVLGSSAGEEYTSYNVIGEIRGSEKADEIILLAAHLDSWDLGTGAIDDGAGVAIIMAAAELIKRMPNPPKRTIRVVLFANEEQGLFGGEEYAKVHQAELSKHLVGVESDFGAEKIWRFSTKFKPSAIAIAQQIHTVLKPLGIEMGNNKATGGADILHSRNAGMAVVTLSQDGTDYFDYHHTINDTFDKINPESLSQNVAAYVAFTWLMSELDGDVGFFGKTHD